MGPSDSEKAVEDVQECKVISEDINPIEPLSKLVECNSKEDLSSEVHLIRGPAKRVNFPSDDSLITGYLEAPNPWIKSGAPLDETMVAYIESCQKMGLKPLAAMLHQLENLEVNSRNKGELLNLKGEKLERRHCEAMEEVFKRIQFKTVDLEATSLEDEGSTALFDMIEYYEAAEHLNIAFNKNINHHGWQACAHMIRRTHSLECLDARHTPMSDSHVAILSRTLRSPSSLTCLHLEYCSLSGRPFMMLMTALKLNITLRELYLSDNKLCPSDGPQLATLLRTNTHLRKLELRNNHLQDLGTHNICDSICEQFVGGGPGLAVLGLQNNQITSQGAQYIAKALINCRNLCSINVGYNAIQNDGVVVLKEAILKNRTLTSLDFESCRLTCEGAVALAEAIADNCRLAQLNLQRNPIGAAGLMALALAMKVNTNITSLELDKEVRTEPNCTEEVNSCLVDIFEFVDRNRLLATDGSQRFNSFEQSLQRPLEARSNSLNQLLGLWDNAPSTPPTPPPRLIVSDSSQPKSQASIFRGLQVCTIPTRESSRMHLRSPLPSPIPSPTRTRFTINRVLSSQLGSSRLYSSEEDSSPSPSPSPSPTFANTPAADCGVTVASSLTTSAIACRDIVRDPDRAGDFAWDFGDNGGGVRPLNRCYVPKPFQKSMIHTSSSCPPSVKDNKMGRFWVKTHSMPDIAKEVRARPDVDSRPAVAAAPQVPTRVIGRFRVRNHSAPGAGTAELVDSILKECASDENISRSDVVEIGKFKVRNNSLSALTDLSIQQQTQLQMPASIDMNLRSKYGRFSVMLPIAENCKSPTEETTVAKVVSFTIGDDPSIDESEAEPEITSFSKQLHDESFESTDNASTDSGVGSTREDLLIDFENEGLVQSGELDGGKGDSNMDACRKHLLDLEDGYASFERSDSVFEASVDETVKVAVVDSGRNEAVDFSLIDIGQGGNHEQQLVNPLVLNEQRRQFSSIMDLLNDLAREIPQNS